MSLMLVSVSHDANMVINGTIPSVRSKWSNWDAKWLFFGHVMPVAPTSVSCNDNSITAFVQSKNQNEVQQDIFGHMVHLVLALELCDVDGFLNGTTAFVGTGWSNGDATWLFDQWCHWHCSWQHMIPMEQDNWNEVEHNFLAIWCHWYWYQWYMMSCTSSIVKLHSLS